MTKLETILKPNLFKKFKEAGFNTVQDVLRVFPLRYEHIERKDRSTWVKEDRVWVEGTVLDCKVSRIRKNLSITRFLLQTETELFAVTLFNRPWIKEGQGITLNAKYEGQNKLTGLNYNTRSLSSQLGLKVHYPNRLGLLEKDYFDAVTMCLPYSNSLDIPEPFKSDYKLLSIQQAIHKIHRPSSEVDIKLALRTLKYEEFLRFETKLKLNRLSNSKEEFGKVKVFDRRDIDHWRSHLPFQLTEDQLHVLHEILDDLQSHQRMYRLLQGDVGSGKTVIAALAMYASVLAHYQCAFLVPTEILAYQHFETLKTYLPETIRMDVLSSSRSPKERKEILQRLQSGELDILVGTHALIQPDVQFNRVGLVIADEQHRFGVNQRRLLTEKGEKVDFLLMSATPIPRTLANVLFGDLSVSTITQYHQSKMPVHTHYIPSNSIKPILPDILRYVAEGDQVYVVCPAIEEDVESDVRTVDTVTLALRKALPKSIIVGSLHGKMKSDEKDKIMSDFKQKKIQFLVSTTVIEVGVNVKDANIMIIYDADRFGLSQLHQLRGRVGRGLRDGHCYLLSDTQEPLSIERLQVIVNSTDGFEIANKDLELRGPGELFGLKQSGLPSFLVANVILDQKILITAQKDAEFIIQNPQKYQTWIQSCKDELVNEAFD